MNIVGRRPFGQKYAFVVAGVIFVSLLFAAGLRSTPGVLILPLEEAFGWKRDVTATSAAIGILLYGLVGPFAAAMMERFGIRRVMLVALVLMSASTGISALMTAPWQLVATWGVLSGLGSGCIAPVLGATIVNRWFATNRGLVMGLLTASMATGTLAFLPALAKISQVGGWQPVVITVSIACALLIPVVFFLLPEQPRDIGLVPYGTDPNAAAPIPARRTGLIDASIGVLLRAMKKRAFWYLFATFFICGFTTNGLIGTHLIALCGDNGIPEVQAAGLLAVMGIFDLVGTTASGWLTDRFDPRKLLFVYYGLRGVSLMYLPYSDFSLYSLSIFAIFYGLDWIATVPPTLRLTNESFGEQAAPVVFGWIMVGHQMGAASAAFLAGQMRVEQGNYMTAFLIAGSTGIVAAIISLLIRSARRTPVPLPAE